MPLPPNFSDSLPSFEDAIAAAGFTLEQEVLPEQPVEASPDPVPAQAPVLPGVGGQASPATPPAVAAPVVPAPVTPPADAPDPKFQAMLDREARIVEREQAYRAAEADLLELRRRVDEFERAKANFLADPHGFVRTLVPEADPDVIAKDLWYGKLGPTAQPPEYRATKEARVAQLEVQKLRSELEERTKRQSEEQARMEAERQESQFVDALEAFASTPSDKYRLVQALVKQKGAKAARPLLHDAARMIAAKGEMPTNESVTALVESYLDGLGYSAPATVAPDPAQPTASAPPVPPNTLRNSHTAVQTARVPLDENDPRVLRQRAYQAMAAATGDEQLARLPID